VTTVVEPQAPPPVAAVPPDRSTSPPVTGRRLALFVISGVFLLCSLASLWWVGVNPISLWQERQDIFNLLERMLPPRIEEPRLVWEAALETFLMAAAGTTLGVVLAVPVAIGAASNITTNPIVRGASRALIVATRALPELVLAAIFVRIYSIGVLPGILAIGIHSVGMLGKLFADAIEQIDPGPREGVQATGAGRAQEFATGVWPQVLPSVIAVSLYRLDINFRASTLLGLVGAGGIGLQIRAHQGSLDYPQLLGVTLVIIAMILLVELVSTSVRARILGHRRSDGSGMSKWLRRTPDVADFRPESADADASSAAEQATSNNGSIRPPWTGDRIFMLGFGIVTLALLVLAFAVPDIAYREFLTLTPNAPGRFWQLVPTSFDWWLTDYGWQLLETVAMGFGATGLALLFSLPTAFLAARNVAPARLVYQAARLFILLVRALPDLIVAVIFVAALGLGPKPGVLALAIGLYGFATKLFADAIEEIAEGPRDGVRATGATRVQELGSSVIPQAMPSIIGNSLYLLDVSIRASTVLGIVGAGGIGFALIQNLRLFNFQAVGGLLIFVFVIVYAIELIATWVRKQVI
jgi:phosphonate transport system permease protein